MLFLPLSLSLSLASLSPACLSPLLLLLVLFFFCSTPTVVPATAPVVALQVRWGCSVQVLLSYPSAPLLTPSTAHPSPESSPLLSLYLCLHAHTSPVHHHPQHPHLSFSSTALAFFHPVPCLHPTMKVLCDVCDRNKAAVMCCQDDAALCYDCDTRVHAANKLASKHHRVSLLTPATAPSCDICQEKTGYYFCLEDRALLCRDCDLSIHSVNTLSSNHQRFLLPGIRVSLEAIAVPDAPESVPEEVPHFRPVIKQNPQFAQYEVPQYESQVASKLMNGGRRNNINNNSPVMDMKAPASVKQNQAQFAPQFTNAAHPARIQGGQGDFNVQSRMQGVTGVPQQARTMTQQNVSSAPHTGSGMLRKSSISEFLTEGVPGWRMDNLLSFADIADGFNSTPDFSSSKADMGSLGDFDWAADFSLFDDQVFGDAQHEVPQMPSPPTASGLSRGSKVFGAVKGNLKQDSSAKFVSDFDNSFVVPDLGLQHSPPPMSPPVAKRRRNFYEY